MSGVAPESERERQLRDFANRVLAWPDPEGPSSVELLPAGYPQEVPTEVVDVAQLRLLGTVVRRRKGEVLDIEVLFEGSHGPNHVMDRYESALHGAGWQNVKQPGLRQGGFETGGMPLAAVLINARKQTKVYIQAFGEGDNSVLRVRFHRASREEVSIDLDVDAGLDRSPLPVLRPPPGVRLLGGGMGGGGGVWSTEAKATTEMSPVDLETHFSRQLEAAAWGRLDGSSDGAFAWSSWVVPDHPPGREWRGTLLVLAAFVGERVLLLRAERKPKTSRDFA